MNERILGVDYGLRRIGLALSDHSGKMATPIETLQVPNKSDEAFRLFYEKIKEIELKFGISISKIVVGFPIDMKGKETEQTELTKKFIAILEAKLTAEIVVFDERLTSMNADRLLMEMDMNRKKRTRFKDQVSASIILQNYLDQTAFKIPPFPT